MSCCYSYRHYVKTPIVVYEITANLSTLKRKLVQITSRDLSVYHALTKIILCKINILTLVLGQPCVIKALCKWGTISD